MYAIRSYYEKIHVIERDIELHKNSLMSIQKEQEKEMERIIGQIIRLKDRVAELKGSIAEIDPEVHAQVLRLEEGTKKFKDLAQEKKFV